MYSIGTSALKAIADALSSAYTPALDGKLMGFVGTKADMTTDAFAPQAMPSPYAVFFALPAVNETGTDAEKHTMAPLDPTTTADIYTVVQGVWTKFAATPISYVIITTIMLPASGISNVIVQFQRGNLADIDSAYRVPAASYFAKDINELFVYNELDHRWVSVTAAQIGVIQIWPDASIQASVPAGWLRCDGSWKNQADYGKLFNVIGNKFDWNGDETKPAGAVFRLPNQSNAIIRYL
jgi:hypothetical protein